jgi:signal peptidase I
MKHLRDILITIVIAVVFFVILNATIGTFRVYGTSMLPNIEPGDCLVVNKLTYSFKEPDRGEIVILHSPRKTDTDLIKRIIALPGDTIEIKNGNVFVNGTALDEPYINNTPDYKYPLQSVPEGNYFVLGDNRSVSADSHLGWYLPRENIIGKAWVRYWPLQKWDVIKHYNIYIDGQLAESNELEIAQQFDVR